MSQQATKILKLLFVLLSVFSPRFAHAEPKDNIAKGKKYVLEPVPNYKHCTDPGDKFQLTDGLYSKGHFWVQKSTVGWRKAHPVIITIDLEVVQPISGISFNTAGGKAGVQWPLSILILVSNDDITYTYVGDLTEFSTEHGQPKAKGYSVHRFWTDRLRAHGRYVKLICSWNGPYIFVDEIEVYRSPVELLNQSLDNKQTRDAKQFFNEMEVVRFVKRRLRNDIAQVRKLLRSVQPKEELEKELASIEEEIANVKEIAIRNFRTVFPLHSLHRRIFSVQGAIWREKGIERLTVWQRNRWDMLSPFEEPSGNGASIDIAMMNKEYRSAAFNLSNTGPGDIELNISVLGLPGGVNPDYLSVHEVPFTDTKSGIPVAAALPFARKEDKYFHIEIPEGMTRQVWLTFHPQNIPADKYSAKVVIKDRDIDIPVQLKIYPLTFPAQPTLHLAGWDYTNEDGRYDVTVENRAALIEHLQGHFVDTPWATSRVMPCGKYDRWGNMTEEPSAENFLNWVAWWPNARNYYVFVAVGKHFSGFEMGTLAFKRAVTQWINWWVYTLGKWNIRPEQLGLLLVDEPRSDEHDKIVVEYAKVIRGAQPKVVIWENPARPEPWKAKGGLFNLSTVLCPNLQMLLRQGKKFADFYIKQRDAGRVLWFYSVSGTGKLLDPYSYHLIQHWFCWKYGAEGSAFWAFGDSNGSSCWNEYLSRVGAYTPIFIDKNSVTPGKHMEAIREGIEDYEYLRMLRDKIAELETRGVKSEIVDSAKQLLSSAADRVTSYMTEVEMMYWEKPKDRSVADVVRIEVLEMLIQLELEHKLRLRD